jgi:hypothetical protein
MPISSSKRAWILVAVLVAAAATGAAVYLHRLHRPLPAASAGTEPDIMTELPPGAPVIAYIDVAALRKLQGSPLAAMLGLAGADPKQDPDYQNFVRDTGFDYTRDLDKVAIGIWPISLPTPNPKLGSNQAVAIAEGRFDREKIKAYALRNGGVATQGAQSYYVVRGDPPVSFAFLSTTRMMLRNGTSLAILGPRANSSQSDSTQARINRVAGAPIFAVARTDALPKDFYDNFNNAPQLKSLARSIKGLTFAGQPQGDRMDLALDAECDSLAHAAEIATLVDGFRMFGTLALSDPKTRRQMAPEQAAFLDAFVSQVKVTHQDRWVRMTLGVTPEMMGPASSNHAASVDPGASTPAARTAGTGR